MAHIAQVSLELPSPIARPNSQANRNGFAMLNPMALPSGIRPSSALAEAPRVSPERRVAPLGQPTAVEMQEMVSSHTLLDAPDGPFTQSANGPADMAADWSMILRTWFGLATDSPVFEPLGFMAYDSPAFPIAGLTTVFNAVQGPIAMTKSSARYKVGQAVGSAKYMHEANTDWYRGLFQGLGGATYGPFRALTVASQLTNASALSPLGQATTWMGRIGDFFFLLFYGFLGKDCVINLGYEKEFRNVLNQGVTPEMTEDQKLIKRLENLQKRFNVTGSYILTKMQGKFGQGPLGDLRIISELKKETYKQCTVAMKHIHKMLKDSGRPGIPEEEPTDAQCKAAIDEVFGALTHDQKIAELRSLGLSANHPLYNTLYDDPIALMGLCFKVTKRVKRRELEMGMVSDSALVKGLKSDLAGGLISELRSQDPVVKEAAKIKAKKAIDGLEGAMKANKVVSIVFLITCVLGVLATILGWAVAIAIAIGVTFNPVALIALAVIGSVCFLIVGIGMLGNDIFLTYQSVANGIPGRKDKNIVTASSVLCLLATAALVILGAITGFGIPLYIAFAVCALWGIGNSLSLRYIHKKEPKTLDQLQKALEEGAETAMILRIYNCLSDKDKDKEAVKAEFLRLVPEETELNEVFASDSEARTLIDDALKAIKAREQQTLERLERNYRHTQEIWQRLHSQQDVA